MYDPMVAKLIVWDVDREHATRRMLRALGEYEIGGLTTLIPFHRAILATPQWANGETCRDLMEDREWLKTTRARGGAPAEAEEGEPRSRSRATTRSRSRASSSTSRVIGEGGGQRRRRRAGRPEAAQTRAEEGRRRRPPRASRSPRRCRARC